MLLIRAHTVLLCEVSHHGTSCSISLLIYFLVWLSLGQTTPTAPSRSLVYWCCIHLIHAVWSSCTHLCFKMSNFEVHSEKIGVLQDVSYFIIENYFLVIGSKHRKVEHENTDVEIPQLQTTTLVRRLRFKMLPDLTTVMSKTAQQLGVDNILKSLSIQYRCQS